MQWRVPLADLEIGEEEVAQVCRILRSKWLSMGPVVREFELAFAEYLGAKYAFAVANGTAALHLAYRAIGLGEGDEVIVPSLTFVATANAALYTGAALVFAEVTGLDDLNISPGDVRRKISPKTRALTVVHYGGYPCDLGGLVAITGDRGIFLIEDAAHAPGATWKGRKVGTIGDVGCFSFFANKNLAVGEGGMVVTDRDDLAERIEQLRSHGMTALTWDRHQGHASTYDVIALGYNYRMDEVRAGLGLVQLAKLERLNQRRREIAGSYCDRLKGVVGLRLPFLNHPGGSVHHLFPILLDDPSRREEFMMALRSKGIQTSIHYPPIHLFSYYRKAFGYREGMLPETEDVWRREVTLPLYPSMGEADVVYVVESVERALRSS